MTEHKASRRGRAQVVARWGRRRAASGNGRRPSSMGWLESAAVVALARLVGSACALGLLAPPQPALTHRRGGHRVTGPAADDHHGRLRQTATSRLGVRLAANPPDCTRRAHPAKYETRCRGGTETNWAEPRNEGAGSPKWFL